MANSMKDVAALAVADLRAMKSADGPTAAAAARTITRHLSPATEGVTVQSDVPLLTAMSDAFNAVAALAMALERDNHTPQREQLYRAAVAAAERFLAIAK